MSFFKEREKIELTLPWKGKDQIFYIPQDYTVEETERILEFESKLRELSKKEVDDETHEAYQKAIDYMNILTQNVTVLLQHYQPEITFSEVKKNFSQIELLAILEFIRKKSIENRASKKKLQ